MALFDRVLPAIAPAFLMRDPRLLWSMILVMDMVLEKALQGIYARMPGIGTPTALAPIGSDRVIPRGAYESDAAYSARLQRSLDTWRLAGQARGVIQAVAASLFPIAPEIRSVLASRATGTDWDDLADGADPTIAPTHTRASPANWNWDGLSPLPFTIGAPGAYWSRRWLVIQASNIAGTSWATPGPLCGAAGLVCGDVTVSCGFSQPASTFQAIMTLVSQWKSAGATWEVIVSFDPTLFPPGDPSGSANLPDGNWATYGKNVAGATVLSRFANARYLGSVT